LIANVDQREGQILHLRLIDPSDPQAASDPLACLNADILRDGELEIRRRRILRPIELTSHAAFQVSPRLTSLCDMRRLILRWYKSSIKASLDERYHPFAVYMLIWNVS